MYCTNMLLRPNHKEEIFDVGTNRRHTAVVGDIENNALPVRTRSAP